MNRESANWCAAVATGLLMLAPTASAQQPAPGAVEQPAIAALERMGGYLRSLKAFQVEAATTSEDVLEDGQKIQFTGTVRGLARMPDRLLLATTNDRNDRVYVYDGKEFTMLARRVNYYATIAAPATVGALADLLDEKYGLAIPLEDLFRWGGAQSPTQGITSAMVIGPSQVGGVSCVHYAFRQDGLDWQVWIQQGDFPLPRRLVLTTTTDPAKPQYTATLEWNLAPSFDEKAFTFVAPKGAGRVVLAELK